MSVPNLRAWLSEGPFGLGMSSGFFGFFAHTGMLLALTEAGFRPARVSGSSAGGMISALWASGLTPERIERELNGLNREAFWDPSPGLGVLRGARFRGLLDTLLPVATFEAAHVPVALSVFDVRAGRTVAITRGALASAIHASCAVPLMFHPVQIDGRAYLDGGIRDRPGLHGMPHGQRVLYHHLTSRSPWRLHGAGMRIPRRDQLVTLAIDDLPRASPFALDEGRRALSLAYERTRIALDRPLTSDIVRV